MTIVIDGLKIIRKLKETERFASFQAEYQGQKVFAKQAKSDNTKVHLSFQAKNSHIVDSLGGQLFRAPKTIIQNDDWLVAEWLDGEPIESQIKVDPEHVAQELAEVINAFDTQPNSTTPLRPIFTLNGLTERINERIHPDIRRSSESLFTESLAAFKGYSLKLQACLQDADVQPEHLFNDPAHEAEFVLVDSEHLNTHWPRYYDLANNYSKYWKRGNQDFSTCLLSSYLKITKLSASEVFEPLAACLIVRAVALHWENDYDPGALDTNIPRSQELLKRVLRANSLDNLL